MRHRLEGLFFCFIRPSCTLSNDSQLSLGYACDGRGCQTRRQRVDVAASIRGTISQLCSAFDERKTNHKLCVIFIPLIKYIWSDCNEQPSISSSIHHPFLVYPHRLHFVPRHERFPAGGGGSQLCLEDQRFVISKKN